MLSSMGFGGEGVFVDAHLVAVCCKRLPRMARRGAERALWDMTRDEWWEKELHIHLFLGNHPDSSRPATGNRPTEKAAMSAVPHAITPGRDPHRHREEMPSRADCLRPRIKNQSKCKGKGRVARTSSLSDGILCASSSFLQESFLFVHRPLRSSPLDTLSHPRSLHPRSLLHCLTHRYS